MIKSGKGFSGPLIVALVGVAILVIGGVFYFGRPLLNRIANPSAQNQTDETANWKTYSNNELGFSIKYPPNWGLYDNATGPCAGLIGNGVLINSPEKVGSKKCPSDEARAMSSDLTVYVSALESLRTIDPYDAKSSITIDGENGVMNFMTEKSERPRQRGTTIFVNHKTKSFYLSFPNTDYSGNHDAIYDQILSTFKFTSPTTDYKTYTNAANGYSLGYLDIYEVVSKTERQISQIGPDQNICIARKGEEACKLIVNVFPLSQYKLIDNPGGFIFYFDVNKKQWLHDKTNDTSQFVPKRYYASVSEGGEAYTYKTGDVKCSEQYTLILKPSYDAIVEIANRQCRDDEGNPLPGYYDFSTDQILSTFKFTDPTANWKTYSNNELGFSIKYPPNFDTTEGFSKGGGWSGGDWSWVGFADNQDEYSSIAVKIFRSDLSIQSWLDEMSSTLGFNAGPPYIYLFVENVRNEDLNGFPILRFRTSAASTTSDIVLIKGPNPNLIFEISKTWHFLGNMPAGTYEQMLSTLKFLNQ